MASGEVRLESERKAADLAGSGEMARHIGGVAARLFAARGYDATSVREIVEAAGVTKPTLYYHFGSKEGLAQALLTRPMTTLAETLKTILETEPDPREALVRIIEAHFEFCVEDPDRMRFIHALVFGPLGSGLAFEVCRIGGSLTEIVKGAIERLAEAGIIEASRTCDCLPAVRGMIIVRTLDFLYRDLPLSAGLGRQIVDDLLQGFGQTSSPSRRRQTPQRKEGI